MLRPSLVKLVAKRNKTDLLRAELVIDTIFDCLKEALRRSERVEVRGLGSFHVRSYKGYQGRNPKTGESIQVRPKRVPFFKPSKAFSGELNDRATVAPGTVRTSRALPSIPPRRESARLNEPA